MFDKDFILKIIFPLKKNNLTHYKKKFLNKDLNCFLSPELFE